MRRFKRHIGILAISVALFAAAPMGMAQQSTDSSVQLSVDQLRLAAELNLRNGKTDRALLFTDALLKRDPKDVTALLIRAHALRIKTDYSEAQRTGRTAWRAAQTDQHKYTAAMIMAQALSSDEKRTRAQLWLRRAAQVAPSKGHAARAAQDFRYVQQRNPWQTHLSFTLAPNTNINNGSSRDTSALLYRLLNPFSVDGVNEVELGALSKALSGIESGLSVQTRYRFHQTERTAHDLRFGLSYSTYVLSQSSKDDLAAEDAQRVANGSVARKTNGDDFAYGRVQIGYGYKKLREDRRGEFSLTADIGQSFYSGARYNSYLRARIGQSYHLSPRTKLDVGLSTDLRQAQRGSDQNQVGLSAGMSRNLTSGDGLYVGASASKTTSESERLEYDEIALRSGYVIGREIMGTTLQFGLHTSFRDYDVSPHDASGRRDFKVGADVTATFKKIDYLGFNPTVSLSASKTNSNIGLYDINRIGLSLGIASAF